MEKLRAISYGVSYPVDCTYIIKLAWVGDRIVFQLLLRVVG